jgi:histidinol-phosphate aminotransferase
MYEMCTSALGGRLVAVPLGDRFELDTAAIKAAVTRNTRIVFVTNPHNPSGVTCALDGLRALARDIAPVTLFVDEAYADFSGESLIDAGTFTRLPNLVVGRTFSKAYGIAGLRAGAVIGAPATLAPIARVIPPYSLNAWAAAALPIAIADREYRAWYLEQASASRALLQQACDRLGLQTWPSAANFMLVRVGARASDIVSALAARGVLVRDRSREAGCEQCLRITAGLVEDTKRAIEVLEEVLCAAR